MGKKEDNRTRKIKELEKGLRELEERWKRALADYQNLEKRVKKEKEKFVGFANKELILKILKVLDDFEKAEEYLKDQGLTLAIDGLRKLLEGEGLEKIKTRGRFFDPEEMECIEVAEGEKENEVVGEIRAGYRLNGEVLRPAQVKVTKKKISGETEEKVSKE